MSNAPYVYDFVELYNPTDTDIDLNGWSVQYASAAGTSWVPSEINAKVIKAHSFFLIQEKNAGGTVGSPYRIQMFLLVLLTWLALQGK